MKALLVLTVSLSFIGAAHADLFGSDPFGTYTDNVKADMQQLGNGPASDYQAQQQTAQALGQATTNAENNLQNENARLAKYNREIADLQRDIPILQGATADALQADQTPPADNLFDGLFRPDSDSTKLNKLNPQTLQEDQAKLAKVQQKAANLQKKMQQEVATNAQNQGKLDQAQKAALLDQQQYQKLTTDQKLQYQKVKSDADSLWAKEKMNGFEGNFLLTDLGGIQGEAQYKSLEVKALQDAADGKLNNTLMGAYVNQQIAKAMAASCGSNFQTACSANNAAGALDIVNKALIAPSNSDSSVNTSATKSGSPDTNGAGAASPANATGSSAGNPNSGSN